LSEAIDIDVGDIDRMGMMGMLIAEYLKFELD
jgi:hypothetical protein